MSKTVSINTLGCRVNMYESCAIGELLTNNGCIISKKNDADYYIVNTCAVTAESERKSRQLVRRCASKGKVLVIGCASQIDKSYLDIPNVIYVGGNRDKLGVVNAILTDVESPMDAVQSLEKAPYENMSFSGGNELFSECRAFIKIQDGCNGRCTYCIIPKCRGSVRSRDSELIVEEAAKLVQNGYKEIILTGIEVGAYNKIPLYELISDVSKIQGVSRLRLGSVSPNVVSDRFLETVSTLDNFMPHIHLSIQSCSDKVLADMKRPYKKSKIYDRVNAIRKYLPNCNISADIIVGFPGETEQDFLETVNALKELGIFHVHSFPYSERKGTPAAEMKGSVPKQERSERNSRLITSCEETRKVALTNLIGKHLKVLIEKIVDGVAIGHTEEFIEASFNVSGEAVGDIVEIKINSVDGSLLIGESKKGDIL